MRKPHIALGLAVLLSTGMALAATAETTGWRGDGSGRFEKTQPPTRWAKDSENIVWKIEPGKGYSSPVLCEGRLFITSHPSDVICIDAASGKELWRRAVGYAEALGKDEAERIAQTHAELETKRREIGKQYDLLRKADPGSPQLETLKQQRKEFDDQRRQFERQFPSEKRGGAGNAAATVVCDGRRVFAVFGTGVVAALDADGQLLWARHLDAPQQGFGHSSSPVIAGGKLIVHIEQLTALEPATGKTLWHVDLPAKFGTPAVAHLGGDDVVITPSGAFVASSDGRVLAKEQFQLSNNSPLMHDGVLYAHEGGKVIALRLPDSLQAPFEPELLWESTGTRDQRMASALLHDGLLYAAGRRGIIDVTDAATGKLVYRKRLDIGELFASPVMAGGFIYYGGKEGQTLVLRPGRKYDEIAVNPSERLNATPVFAGRRMYLRSDNSLYCIESR